MKSGPKPRDHKEHVKDFWAAVKKTDGCWLWTKSKNKSGYGKLLWFGRLEAAHRISYLISKGQVPGEHFVLHRCDNPSCVNPDHLFLGDHQANMDDSKQKLRHTHGERHPQHKLTEIEVKAIRIFSKSFTQTKVAEVYGISFQHVSAIVKGVYWQGVTL